jgi:hypothetical protein
MSRFTSDVAKAKDIIPNNHATDFISCMVAGYHEADLVKVQYGLKGFFKTKSPDHERHKFLLYRRLVKIYNQGYSSFAYDEDNVLRIVNILNRRIELLGGIGYHELNCLADAIAGEQFIASPPIDHIADDLYTKTPWGLCARVPLYAYDNHTYTGRALMRRYAPQLRPNATQNDIDIRYCGAYYGVAWRVQAYKQHDSINVPWSLISWDKDLYSIVDRMWY